jgi:Tol biopolymer transport system component
LSALTLSPGTRLGPYEILSALGVGGMGEVYRATDTNLKRQVAIKVLPQAVAADAERLARFQREAEVLAALNHPNIAHIHGLEKSDGTIALVMELVEGPTLADRIAQGAIPLVEALPIAKQIAEALEAAHEQGIIHRDLKPANVKIREDGTVKVLDFGLAKAMDSNASSAANATMSPTISMHATQAGIILGTAAYMSPEQAAGKAVDKRSDLWAFGVVLLEMLTGRQVFGGETISHVLASVLKDEPDWTALPANTPAPIRKLLRRCLEKDRKRRLDSAADARLEIEDALTSPAAEASPAVPPRRVAALPIAFALAGVALVATLVTWGLMRPAPEQRPLTRLSVDLGPDAVGGPQITVAISPDGRRIVFPIRGANGTLQLATRLLDQATPTPLPGTENGAEPFFSPDGQWIAFAADGKLKKISVLGGAAVEVCAASNFRGGSWGEDGTMVAALNSITGLSRIPAAGGTPQLITTLVNGESTHRWPQILPGGQSVLFTASTNGGQWEDATVQVLSVKTGQVTTVAHGGYFGRYMAGHLTYLHQGVLLGVPFDPATLAVRGTPVPLLDDMASDPTTAGGQLDVSRTGTVVYRSGKGAAPEFPVVWLDSKGKTEPLLSKPRPYATPRVSPDGRRLALTMDTGKGLDLYAYDMPRDALSQLTFNGRGNTAPVWTPDGKHIVYASGADYAIWWIRGDGAGDTQRLLESKNNMRPSSFSPDGRYLSYQENTADTGTDLWILPLDASDSEHPKPGTPEVFLKTPVNEALAAFSPDGRWISYLSQELGRPEVYVRPFHGSASGKWKISTSGGSYSFWSRDGRALYYLAQDQRIMVVEYTATGESFTAGTPRVWSETPVRATQPSFQQLDLAPDGKRFAILPREAVADEKGSVHATFLLNFFDELQRRLP